MCKIGHTFVPAGNVEIRVVVCTVWQYFNEENSCEGLSVMMKGFFHNLCSQDCLEG